MHADMVLHNLKALSGGVVLSAEVDVVAIQGNKIVFVGQKNALESLRGPNTRMLDCQGGVVVPGFNDAHCHPIALAVTRQYVDCGAPHIHCIGDIQADLRKKAEESEGECWIRGANLDADGLAENRAPTQRELDAVVPHLPVVVLDRAGQYCVVNTVALARCKAPDNTRSTNVNHVPIDGDSELPTGIIRGDNAQVAGSIPPLSERDLEIGLRDTNREFLSRGITSIQDTSWSNRYRHWQAMKSFKRKGLLDQRITMLVGIDALDEFLQRGMKTGTGDGFLRLGAAKIALDESTSRDDPPQTDINCLAMNAHIAGFQLAFHVPNVHLLRKSLRALNFVEFQTGQRCPRPRFEHCPVCPPSVLPDIARSGAIVVSQPNLLHETGPSYMDRVTEEELQWVFPYRSYVDHGIEVAFSSDAPLTSSDPFQAVKTAVTRSIRGGGVLSKYEQIALPQALNMYSRSGAYCNSEETLKGSLAVGQVADVVVLDSVGRDCLEDIFFNATVLMTMIDGKVVWSQ